MKNFTQVPNEGIKWSRKLTAERYPKPLSPLGWSNIQAVFDEGVRAFAVFMGLPLASNAPLAISVNGWILANENAFDFKNHFKINLTKREQASLLLETISLLLGSSNPLKSLKSLVHWLKYPEKSATRLGNSLNSIVLPFAGQAIFSYLQRISNDIDQSWENTKISFQEEVAKIGNLIESEEDPPKLLILGEKLRAAMISYIKPDLVIFAVKEIASIIIGELATLAGKKDARQIAAQLSLGLQENVTIGLHEKLEELVKVLKENGDLSSEETDSARFQIISDKGKNEVSKFLRQFGHLTCSWDIMQPTWGEDRDEFFAFLNHRVKVTSGMRAGVTKFESNESSFLNSLEANPFAVDLAKKLISILRKFVKIDDEHHFHTARVIPPTRSLVRKLGRFLAQKALIEKADDIFWLTDQEVRDLLADEAKKPQIRLVEARKISFQNAISEGPPDENFERKSCENSNIMAGLGVSGGVGRGFVRPVSNFQDLSKIQKGDVMVTTSPDPFFAIVYPQITALVAETGALLSHGAVLAREYNLPAVFGVTKACERLIPGTLVEVNGDTGFVCVIEKKFPQ